MKVIHFLILSILKIKYKKVNKIFFVSVHIFNIRQIVDVLLHEKLKNNHYCIEKKNKEKNTNL